jgi:hypothetical protein
MCHLEFVELSRERIEELESHMKTYPSVCAYSSLEPRLEGTQHAKVSTNRHNPLVNDFSNYIHALAKASKVRQPRALCGVNRASCTVQLGTDGLLGNVPPRQGLGGLSTTSFKF